MNRLAIYALLLLGFTSAWAAPVDLSTPKTALGAANTRGFVEIWRELDEVDFGNGLKLPFRIQFSSERQSDSSYFGKGWWCPMLESTAYLKREKMLCATLMCGKVMYLRKDSAQVNTFYTLDKEWKGTIEGKLITISREDGWRLIYENGRIKELRTDKERTLNWKYSGTLVSEVSETSSPSSPFKVDLASKGTPKGVYVNNKLHSFTLDKRPKIQSLNGKSLVTGFDAALLEWQFPEGNKEAYQFEVTDKVQPNLKLTDPKGLQNTYVWDAASGRIVSDGDWTYDIAAVEGEFELPKMRRKNTQGKEEFLLADSKRGIVEEQNEVLGHIVRESYKSAGPLYGKPQKVEKILPDGTKVPLYQYSYDEAGRLVRKTGPDGYTKAYTYDDKGKLAATKLLPLRDPALIAQLKAKEKALVQLLAKAEKLEEREDITQKLAFFYIHQMKDVSKALPLTKGIQDRQILFNIKAHAVDHDPNADIPTKIEGYKKLLEEFPEQKELLETAIKARTQELKYYATKK